MTSLHTIVPAPSTPSVADRREQAAQFLERNGICRVYVAYSDIHGIVRGKLVEARQFLELLDSGMRNCCGVFSKDLTGTPVAETGILWEHGADDNVMRPCVGTLSPAPWQHGAAIVIADVIDATSDTALEIAPREVLKRVLDAYRQAGALPAVGVELEFYLFTDAGEPVTRGTQAYSLQQVAIASEFVEAATDALSQMGAPIESISAENDSGQFELSLGYAGGLEIADWTFKVRHAIKEVATRMSMRATFMAVPRTGMTPSGLHIHVSLVDRKSGNELFFVRDDGAISESMQHFVAGLLAHSNDALSLMLPTINSYKAPAAGSFFPKQSSWGLNNRSALIRVPDARACNRIENRLPTSDTNPYLAIATTLALGLHGLRNRPPLAAPVTGNGLERCDLPALDLRFEPALERLEAQSWLIDFLGAEFVRVWIAVKRSELRRFQNAVTDWERSVYETML